MATRWDKLPNPMEYDTREAGKDIRAALKALKTPEHIKGGALDAVKAAGMRGGTRLGGAAGLAQLALEAGMFAGKELDEKTGLGKKMVDKSGLGNMVDKAVNARDKVELSKGSKERLQDEDLSEMRRDIDSNEKARRAYSGRYEDGTRLPDEDSYKGDGMKKGGKVSSASKRADGIAQRGKTKGRMC
jgi:hypothetical protein